MNIITKIETQIFALPEGITGQLQWPSAISKEAFADFEYQLEGLSRRVTRSIQKDTDPKTDVSLQDEKGEKR